MSRRRAKPGSARRAVQDEIDEEIAFHLEASARDRVIAGMGESEAKASAAADFGDVMGIRSACEGQRLWRENMLHRFHLTLTLFLALCTGFLALQWGRDLKARQVEIDSLRAHIEQLMPSAAPTGTREDFQRYAVGDRLQVLDLAHSDRLELEQEVREDGTILVPELGWVHVAGLTRDELTAALAARLSVFYRTSPMIEVVLKDPAIHRVAPVDQIFAAAGDRLRFADPIRPDEWSGNAGIEADGTCLFPVIGRLSVAGLSRAELEAFVRGRMDEFYRERSEARLDILKGPVKGSVKSPVKSPGR